MWPNCSFKEIYHLNYSLNNLLSFLVIIVSGLQIAITVLGQFNSARLEDYVPCVMEQLSLLNQSLPDNSTFPVSNITPIVASCLVCVQTVL